MKNFKILLFLTALSQVYSSFFTSFTGGGNFQQLLITPAGYTFAIWGAITIFSFIFATYHLFFDQRTFTKNFYLNLSFVYILFTVWLLVAERNLLGMTVLVFIPLYLALLKAYEEVIFKHKLQNYWEKIFLTWGTSMYVGWTTIAVVLNFAVWIFSLGIDKFSQTGILVQSLIVVAATGNAIYMLQRFKKNIPLFATFWWAFVGLLVGLVGRSDTGVLIGVTLVCVAVLNYFYFIFQKRPR